MIVKRFHKTLEIHSSPHILSGSSTDSIMFNVVLALLPVSLFAVYQFGLATLVILSMAVVSCVVTEHLICRLSGRETTITDWSAAVTGLLYGMTLPPSLPLWMVAVGGVLGIGLGKTLFGGLGYNCFNPALVGRALMQAAFPAAMTTWPVLGSDRFTSVPSSSLAWPLAQPVYDGVTGATALSQWKFEQVSTMSVDLFLGTVPGSVGETSALMILVGGIYLAARRMLNWRIPAAILATVAVGSFILQTIDANQYAGPWFMLFSGGLMLGAVFMATDMVASPMTHRGCVLYGMVIGLLVIVIRVWGGMPEGVMYAILLGNAISPHIDYWIRPSVYGSRYDSKKQASGSLPPSDRDRLERAPQAVDRNVPTGEKADEEKAAEVTSADDAGTLRVNLQNQEPAKKNDTPVLAMYLTLISVGAVCGLAIVSVYLMTQPIIQQNQINYRQQAVLSVLPGATTSQAFQLSDRGKFVSIAADQEGADIVFAGYDDQGDLIGIALQGQRAGYQDLIHLIYGYSFESQTILGFRVLSSRETPGLGDRIEHDENFLRNFNGLDVRLTADGVGLIHPIEFVKPGEKEKDWQVDGISGATISATTVTRIIGEGAERWLPLLHRRVNDFKE